MVWYFNDTLVYSTIYNLPLPTLPPGSIFQLPGPTFPPALKSQFSPRNSPFRPSTVVVRWADSAYVEGSSGTNFCPAGSEQISSEASCKAAAASALNTYYEVTVNNSESPRGCYGARGNPDMWCGVPHTPNCTLVYFNLHATGSGSTDEHHPDGSYFPVCLRTGQWW